MDKYESKLNLTPNVIEGEELEELFNTVFSDIAYYVSKTYGPFGQNTGYQERDKILTTKDGWTVEQGIIYSRNMLANIVRKFIIEVSRSINVHAGDGTTTGVIAANEINKLIMDYKKSHRIHSKFLSSAIKYCVESICIELKKNAVKITDENMDDIIYRIAEVSLDWDKEFAGYIRDIYHATKNPVIRVQNSGFESSYVEYMDGYDLSAKIISEFKVDNAGSKKYTVEKPVILVFSYTISAELFETLLYTATYLATQGKELVIMAPDFEKDFRDNFNALCIQMIKQGKDVPALTMIRYFAEYNIEREMLNDFCFLTGANIVSREYNEVVDVMKDFAEIGHMNPPIMSSYDVKSVKGKKKYEEDVQVFNDLISVRSAEFNSKFGDYTGTCDKLVVDDKTVTVSGFGGLENTEAMNTRKNVIQADIQKSLKDMTAKSFFTDEIKLKKLRLGKLQLKMGIINVGGFGDQNLKATRDALDDAINACSNAYLEGVVVGGGVAIPVTINTLLDKLESDEWRPSEEKGIDDFLVRDILTIISKGFINTWKIMLMNRYVDGKVEKEILTQHVTNVDELITACIMSKKPWNLITEQFDDSIIHPVRVETEVVKGCLHLVLTTTTMNQLLYNGFEGLDLELKEMREIKEDETNVSGKDF